MKNTIIRATIAVVAIISFSSCFEDKEYFQNGDYMYTRESLYSNLYSYSNLDDGVVTFPGGGGQKSLDFRSNPAWAAKGMADWVTVSPSSGAMNYDGVIGITTTENPALEPRTNIITLAPTKFPAFGSKLTIEQEPLAPYVEWVDASAVTVPADAATYEFPFITNGPLETAHVVALGTYSSLVESVSISGSKVVVKTNQNMASSSRQYYIRADVYVNGKFYYTSNKYITQSGYTISSDVSSYYPSAAGGQEKITFSTNLSWKVNSTASWITLSPAQGYAGNNCTVTATIAPNGSSTSRTAYIEVLPSTGTSYIKRFTISQSGVSASSTDKTFSDVSAAGATLETDFTCDIPWTATCSTGAEVAPASGSAGTTKLRINVLPNYSTTSRSGTITFMSTDNAKLWEIGFTQNAPIFKAETSEINFDGRASAKPVKFTSELPWKVFNLPAWLTPSSSSGPASTGVQTLNLTSTENTSSASRSATIRIGYSTTLSALVKITQAGAALSAIADINAGWEKADKAIEITSADAWTAALSDDSWMSLSKYEGSGRQQVTLSLSENSSDKTREGSILLVSGSRTETIKVAQIGQYIRIESSFGEMGCAQSALNIEVETSVGANPKVKYYGTTTGWLSFTDQTSRWAAETIKYRLVAEANPNSFSRGAEFNVSPSANYDGTGPAPQGIKYVVWQDGRDLSCSSALITINSAGGTSDAVTVKADGAYTVTRGADSNWFTISKSNDTFTIVATANTTGKTRRGEVKVALSGLPDGQTKEVTIPVVQGDHNIGLDIDDYAPDKVW